MHPERKLVFVYSPRVHYTCRTTRRRSLTYLENFTKEIMMIRNPARLIGRWNCYKPSVVQILQVRAQSEVPATGSKPSIAEKKHPTNMEKRFIVWMGKYKTIDEVPDFVPVETLDKAKNKARIRIANYMMLLTVIACGVMVYLGKKSAAEGNSVFNENLAWHKQMKEDYEKQNKK